MVYCRSQMGFTPIVKPLIDLQILQHVSGKLKNNPWKLVVFLRCFGANLCGGNSNIFYFHPYLGEDSHFD